MPTAEQMVFCKPGTHLFAPVTFLQPRSTDPPAPLDGQGVIMYCILSTENGRMQLKCIFPGGTRQVIAQSTCAI